jgi:hypothetical protein
MTARNSYLLRNYGITEAQYARLLAAHVGRCWICGKLPAKRRLHVEHDHKTGRIRGLACWKCNTGLARYSDNPVILRAAADYLESDEADRVLGREQDAKNVTSG